MRDPRYKHELGDGGGVKLEFVQNSFDLIWKFATPLIGKGKNSSKNSRKINLNSIHSMRLQLHVGVKSSKTGFDSTPPLAQVSR